jgi:hypothetical protein
MIEARTANSNNEFVGVNMPVQSILQNPSPMTFSNESPAQADQAPPLPGVALAKSAIGSEFSAASSYQILH